MSKDELNPKIVPSPEAVLQAARAFVAKESELRKLTDYRESIDYLRTHGYSWRRIAVFLNDNGIEVTFNDVYYAARQRKK